MSEIEWVGHCGSNGRPRKVKPDDLVRTAKDIHGFATMNGLRNSLYKTSGGVHRLGMDGILHYVAPHYSHLDFKTVYNLLTIKN